MKKINHALIMAAGRGTRMMPLTESLPKALVELNGESLISYGLKEIKKNIPFIHSTVGYKKAILANFLIENDISSIINTEGKGNCWWIFNSLLKHIDEPILVLTCDNVVSLEISLLLNDYINFNEPPCMLIPVTPIPGIEGDFIFHNNYKVLKISRIDPCEIYCSGIQILNPFKINKLFTPVENFNDLWQQMIKKEQLICSKIYPKKWLSFDTIEHIKKFEHRS